MFKRLVGMVVQPLSLMILLLLAGFVVLRVTRRKGWRTFGLCLFAAAAAIFVVSCCPPITRWSARVLERQYAPLPGTVDADTPYAIVVLGSGVEFPDDLAMPALSRLNDSARARLVEGVRLARLYPEARLVTSGYGLGLENCADAMALAAMELGVDESRIDRLADSLDTGHEARLAKGLVGERKVLLVTSAVHMPRSMEFFREQGVNAVPAPCDYTAPVSDATMSAVNRHRWQPRGKFISDTEGVWREYLGLFYFHWLRGKGSED